MEVVVAFVSCAIGHAIVAGVYWALTQILS